MRLVFGEVLLYIIYVIPSVTLYTNILHSEGGNEKKKKKKSRFAISSRTLYYSMILCTRFSEHGYDRQSNAI